MKDFFLRHKKLHIWLLCALAAIVFFHVGKHSRPLMNAFASCVTEPLKRALGALCALVPFSVAEVLIAAALAVVVLYIIVFIVDLVRREDRRRIIYPRILVLVCAGLTFYAGFCLLWGVNYYIDGFQDKSGLHAQPVTVTQLVQVTERFAGELNRLSGSVDRDENGVFAEPRDEIYAAASTVYRGVEEEYPFLVMKDHTPKRVVFSKLMSQTNFTGFFFPFTGEANLNDHSPACLLPATIAHEMAHQRSIASEQECNFLAVLVCEKSGNAAYAYSGALFGFIHLSNALYKADPEAWSAIHATLNEDVQADLRDNNHYWSQFESKTAEVSQDMYDSFLKGYGEESGIQSYGEVVDLLVAYYGEQE